MYICDALTIILREKILETGSRWYA